MISTICNMEISRRVREARLQRGVSLQEVARLTGISEKRLSLCERGERAFRFFELESMQEALDCSYRFLVWGGTVSCFDTFVWAQLYDEGKEVNEL